MKTRSNVPSLIFAMLLTACAGGSPAGDKAKEEDEGTKTLEDDETLGDEAPADSTGATGPVTVDFGATSSAALALDEVPAAELAVSDSISLSVARFNIAAIKVKASKDPTAKEAEHEKEAVAEEAEAVKEVDAVAEAADAALVDKDKAPEDAAKKDEMKGRREKIAAKKGDLAAKEKDRLDKHAAKDKGTRFKGPYVYDAVTGVIDGDLPPVDLVDGSYRRVEFQLKRSLDVADDDPLLGNVFYIKGTVTKADDSTVPFEIEWHVAMNFRLKAENPFAVVAGGENKLSIAFDMVKWFDGIDLAAAEADADGTVYVNKQSNREILKQLHKNMKIHTRFGKDSDGDGKLGDAEKAGEGEDTTDATVE